jgi:radical SAM protein with 4Fe4S-binding SPASM domain
MPTFSQKANLLKGLLTGDVARTGPIYVDIDLTNRCNLRCLGCPYHSPHVNTVSQRNPAVTNLSLDLFKGLCSELKTMNTNSLIFQGTGEPLLHPDVFDMISIAKAAGFHVTLLTNGTLLDPDGAQALIHSGLDTIRVSLWASSVEQYQLNYPGNDPANFGKVVNGLKLLAKLKDEQKKLFPHVLLYYVINRHNFQTIDAMVDLASGTGSNGLFFSPMHTVGGLLTSFGLSVDEERSIHLSLSRAKQRLKSLSISENVDWALLRYKMAKALWQTHPCYITWFHARIRVDGMVQPCGRCDSHVQFGNLHENSFDEIWNGPAIRRFRRQTLTSEGLATLREHCNCTSCCYIGDNLRLHRIFRWFRPFAQLKRPINNEARKN